MLHNCFSVLKPKIRPASPLSLKYRESAFAVKRQKEERLSTEERRSTKSTRWSQTCVEFRWTSSRHRASSLESKKKSEDKQRSLTPGLLALSLKCKQTENKQTIDVIHRPWTWRLDYRFSTKMCSPCNRSAGTTDCRSLSRLLSVSWRVDQSVCVEEEKEWISGFFLFAALKAIQGRQILNGCVMESLQKLSDRDGEKLAKVDLFKIYRNSRVTKLKIKNLSWQFCYKTMKKLDWEHSCRLIFFFGIDDIDDNFDAFEIVEKFWRSLWRDHLLRLELFENSWKCKWGNELK